MMYNPTVHLPNDDEMDVCYRQLRTVEIPFSLRDISRGRLWNINVTVICGIAFLHPLFGSHYQIANIKYHCEWKFTGIGTEAEPSHNADYSLLLSALSFIGERRAIVHAVQRLSLDWC